MPRVISFLVLLTIILLVGAIFFRVMAQFFVPLFLAAVLIVVFQPLHAWTMARLPGRPRLSALCTTIMILLVVLLPLSWIGFKAYVELHNLLATADSGTSTNVSQPLNPVTTASADVTTTQKNIPAAADSGERTDETQQPNPDSTDPPEVTPPVVTPSQTKVSNALTARLQKVASDLKRVLKERGIEISDDTFNALISRAANVGGALAINVVQSVIGILFGLVIMVIALYYFLADGPVMIRTVMELSPLEAEYEQELLLRFGQVSRAVVVATLLAAVVQGLLAGVGYYFALPSTAPIFLLIATTMITAMVPFFGAAVTWAMVCGWIYLYGEHVVDGKVVQGDWVTALVLLIYSTIVVSGVDNIIKPLVLKGQSNLHPLVALLSILGGVPTLGPVGIIIGPMVVSFLQALLEMLRKEIESFAEDEGNVVGQVLADGTSPVGSVALATGQPVKAVTTRAVKLNRRKKK